MVQARTAAAILALTLSACSDEKASPLRSVADSTDDDDATARGSSSADSGAGTPTDGGACLDALGTSDGGVTDSPRPTGGAAGSSGAAGGSSNGEASAGGSSTAAEDEPCDVVPVTGTWAGWLGWAGHGASASLLMLERSDAGISGRICVELLELWTETPQATCMPIEVTADRGRSLSFRFADPNGGFNSGEARLTSSPEGAELLGDALLMGAGGPTDADGRVPAMFVPYADPPETLDATSCSGGEPTGECFRSSLGDHDYVVDPVAHRLADDDLLLTWDNHRATQHRLGFARFDAESGQWQPSRLIAETPVDRIIALQFGGDGVGVVAWLDPDSQLLTSLYDPKLDRWSEVWPVDHPPAERIEGVRSVVDAANDISLLLVTRNETFERLGYTNRFDATAGAWQPRVAVGEARQLAFDADGEGLGLLVSVRHSPATATSSELWFSRRDADGNFDEVTQFYASSGPGILDASVAVAPGGDALVAWEEGSATVLASFYSREADAFSDPLVVAASTDTNDLTASHDRDGNARLTYSLGDPLTEILATTFDTVAGVWSEPVPAQGDAVPNGRTHSVEKVGMENSVLHVEPRLANDLAPPDLTLGSCEGY